MKVFQNKEVFDREAKKKRIQSIYEILNPYVQIFPISCEKYLLQMFFSRIMLSLPWPSLIFTVNESPRISCVFLLIPLNPWICNGRRILIRHFGRSYATISVELYIIWSNHSRCIYGISESSIRMSKLSAKLKYLVLCHQNCPHLIVPTIM